MPPPGGDCAGKAPPGEPSMKGKPMLNQALDRLNRAAIDPRVDGILLAINRVAVGAIFFLSGRTKVTGLFTLTDATFELFRTDYKIPLIPPVPAAYIAAITEHLCSVMLFLGLGTRLAALALLGMTTVIEVFVYPDAWPTHLSWAGLMVPLVLRGGGRFSIDAVVRRRG